LKGLAVYKPISLLKLGIYGILVLAIYQSALQQLVTNDWRRDSYSYCVLVPFVVLYLIWTKREDLGTIASRPSWKGIIPFLLGIFLFWLGELSGEYFTLYLSLWLILVSLCWLHFGWIKLKSIGFAFIFMLTMFPLPWFLNTKLMLELRLISSKLGVFLIQMFGLPVTREGNIIDLGFVQLQVVEACSGLHTLISLVVLCLLMTYFFKDHIWKRSVLLISSIPLAISANSIRIALTAILHKYFGSDVAQGFFHSFSGLMIFVFCIPVLVIEMKILEKLPPHDIKSQAKSEKVKTKLFVSNSTQKEKKILPSATLGQPIFFVAVSFLIATLAFSQSIEFREKIPTKKALDQFPLKFSDWYAEGKQPLEQVFINKLDLSEYTIAEYKNSNGESVNTYVAYYESQSKGKSIHTPESCIPGSGWLFEQSGTVKISGFSGKLETMEVNRAVIQYGKATQIVYYWFSLRGRILNNAYQLKIYNFWDALTMQRTDGALIRLITPVYENEKLADADARMQNFVRNIVPVLNEFIPGRELHSSS
jgi:exosortase D (VPLPA-CTERM-specific)